MRDKIRETHNDLENYYEEVDEDDNISEMKVTVMLKYVPNSTCQVFPFLGQKKTGQY